jgi:VWFA-related protein
VEVGVVVRDRDGHAVDGLTRNDFLLADQGTPREITSFSMETTATRQQASVIAATPAPSPAATQARSAAPATSFVLLYFEDFSTNTAEMKRAQIAGRGFINEGLDPGDRIAIASTSGDWLDFTDDKAQLLAAIDRLKAHPKFARTGQGNCPKIPPFQAYQIVELHDSFALQAAKDEAKGCSPGLAPPEQMILAQAEMTWSQARIASQVTLDALERALRSLEKMPGQKLVLMSASGFITSTLEPQRDKLIQQALRAGIVVSSVDAKSLWTHVPGGTFDEVAAEKPPPVNAYLYKESTFGAAAFVNNQIMSDLADATGGQFFHNNNALAHGFRQLGSLPEVKYMLGFSDTAADSKYHKLKVTLREPKGYTIQARPGYFATRPAAPEEREVDRELRGISVRQAFPVSLAFRQDGATLKTQVHIDLAKLRFPIREGRMVQQLTIVLALIDQTGNISSAKEGTMDFALGEETHMRLLENGINAGLNLEATRGKYRLRAVVKESVDGKMATSERTIDVN